MCICPNDRKETKIPLAHLPIIHRTVRQMKMSSQKVIAIAIVIIVLYCCPSAILAASCVWKVTSSDGRSLYLGGSFHALRPSDYPLPSQYNRAFDACSHLAFEDDPKAGEASFRALVKAGEYPKGDSLKNHVDPRTYAYLRRFFGLHNVSEDKFSRFRPWLIDIILSAPPPEYYQLGVERFLERRAKAAGKPITGLESAREHNDVFTGLTDRQAEALLLTLFINAGHGENNGVNMFQAWRHGDAEVLAPRRGNPFAIFPPWRFECWTHEITIGCRRLKTIFAAGRSTSLSSEQRTWAVRAVYWLCSVRAAARSSNFDRRPLRRKSHRPPRMEVFAFVKSETLFFVRRWLNLSE